MRQRERRLQALERTIFRPRCRLLSDDELRALSDDELDRYIAALQGDYPDPELDRRLKLLSDDELRALIAELSQPA